MQFRTCVTASDRQLVDELGVAGEVAECAILWRGLKQ